MNGKSWILVMIAILGVVVGAVLYIGDLKERISAIEKSRARPDPFTGKDAIVWSVAIQRANPKLVIPTPVHHSDE